MFNAAIDGDIVYLFRKGCGQRSCARSIPVQDNRRKPRHDFAKTHGTLASTSGLAGLHGRQYDGALLGVVSFDH
ncbi:hypothetical protein [Burkholderia sp. Bp9143]|uniref:hypothetical protein n=1 Tax=Burkholderia sp. Bp9143 TaxID=2184574 RepID=UPI001626FD5C|nr:hypothetical protein [Burkholderia sp. Bp9143]